MCSLALTCPRAPGAVNAALGALKRRPCHSPSTAATSLRGFSDSLAAPSWPCDGCTSFPLRRLASVLECHPQPRAHSARSRIPTPKPHRTRTQRQPKNPTCSTRRCNSSLAPLARMGAPGPVCDNPKPGSVPSPTSQSLPLCTTAPHSDPPRILALVRAAQARHDNFPRSTSKAKLVVQPTTAPLAHPYWPTAHLQRGPH